eukprot:TRINITY_DN50951_c0_g1_i3.p1 TRINITY_DN50951_c0_g1~~TRINITY_DN50951_c0_g1_i3.p1  ORF type:complete len:280 (+),score=99.46 TRINITY_DN50951_c0_g1_i3:80-919(+)
MCIRDRGEAAEGAGDTEAGKAEDGAPEGEPAEDASEGEVAEGEAEAEGNIPAEEKAEGEAEEAEADREATVGDAAEEEAAEVEAAAEDEPADTEVEEEPQQPREPEHSAGFLQLSTALEDKSRAEAIEACKSGVNKWQPTEAGALVQAFKLWPHDPELVFFACSGTAYLANMYRREGGSALVQEGAIEALIGALEAHPGNTSIQCALMYALRALARMSGVEGQNQLNNSNLRPMVESLLKKTGQTKGIKREATKLLSSMEEEPLKHLDNPLPISPMKSA